MCLESCVGATIFSGNIPKSLDYMPRMPNKIVSVDPEGGCMVGLSGPPPTLLCVNPCQTGVSVYKNTLLDHFTTGPDYIRAFKYLLAY